MRLGEERCIKDGTNIQSLYTVCYVLLRRCRFRLSIWYVAPSGCQSFMKVLRLQLLPAENGLLSRTEDYAGLIEATAQATDVDPGPRRLAFQQHPS